MKKIVVLLVCLAMMLGMVPAMAESTTASGLPALTKDTICIGMLVNGELPGEGFAYSLYKGFKALEDEGIKVLYAANIPESGESKTAMESLIANGCNVIYGCTYGYRDYMIELADKYPDVYFNHYSGDVNKDNLATFFPKDYQGQYLCGIVAGMKTETNQIGYICSYPIPQTVRMANAFTLGVQSVNPDAVVNVKWTNSWFDPALESTTAKDLVNSGCDVISDYLSTLNCAIGAAEKGAYGFGYAFSGYDVIPDTYLTNPACDWVTFFHNDVERIINGEWTGTNQWLGIAEGLVSLGEVYNSSEECTAKVDEAYQGFADGTLDIWAQEIVDNAGNVVSPEGETFTDEELLNMFFFVQGVNGSVQ